MKKIGVGIIFLAMLVISYSCGVDGDPGHCYFSLDWEYYNEEHGVYEYSDYNPNVPDGDEIVARQNYDCYPGTYGFNYESEDEDSIYIYAGTYTLLQELGSPARPFEDGMDGIDTYFELFLYVKARKATQSDAPFLSEKKLLMHEEKRVSSSPEKIEEFYWEETKNGWTMRVTQVVSTYKKEH